MDVKDTLKKAADKVGEAAKKTGDARDHARRLALAALIGICALQTACPGYFWRQERREERWERRDDRVERRQDNRQERREDRRERWD